MDAAMKSACAQIFLRTGGKVDIQMYPSGEMLVYDEGIEAVKRHGGYVFHGPKPVCRLRAGI